MAGISNRRRAVRALGVALLVAGGLALVQAPAEAAAGGTFTRTPSSGPVGTTITVSSVTPCPVTPSDLIASPSYDSSVAYVSLLPVSGGSGPGAQVEVPPTGGPWTATLTIQPSQGHSSDPGEYVIRAGCGAYFVSPPCTPTPGAPCLPRTDGTEELLTYEPQSFQVCATGQAGCAPTGGMSTTTTFPILGNPAATTTSTLDIFGAGSTTTVSPTTTAAPPTSAAPSTTAVTAAAGAAGAVSSSVVPPGAAVTAGASGFGPFSEGSVLFASTPVVIGAFTADAAGNVSQVVTIPATAEPGRHHVIFRGTDAAGNPHDVAIPITVQRHLPVGGTGASRTTQVALVFVGLGLLLLGRSQLVMGRSRQRT